MAVYDAISLEAVRPTAIEMSLTVLIIALLPASVVFIVAATTRSQLWTSLTAIVAAGVGAFKGDPAYIALDVLTVVAVYWICMRTLRKLKQAARDDETLDGMKKSATDDRASDAVDATGRGMRVAPAKAVESTKGIRRALRKIAKGALIGGLVGLAWFAYHEFFQPHTWQTPTPTQGASASIPSATQEQKTRDYELTLASVERQYPELNQDSSQYRQDLVDKVVARIQIFVANGTAKDLALRMAADEVMFAEMRQKTAHDARGTPRQIHKCEAGGRVTYSDAPCGRK